MMILFKSIVCISAIALGVVLGCRTPDTGGMLDGEPSTHDDRAPSAAKQSIKKTPIVESAQGKQEPPESGKIPQDKKKDPIDGHEFPPTMPDTVAHEDSWQLPSCLRCHETGVQGATIVRHHNLPEILMSAMCRSCHIPIPGSKPRKTTKKETPFEENAFPPMIPASTSHPRSWWKDDCLMCHEVGLRGATKVVHRNMPRILLSAKCRTCHVQVRAVSAEQSAKNGH
jgi:Cytochrome c554 and c-prime